MTERYALQFPRGVAISITPYDKDSFFNETFISEFKRQIRDAFREYTEGTNPDYILQDKIMFINFCCSSAEAKEMKPWKNIENM